MAAPKQVNKAEDVVAKASDFVLEYKDVSQFTKNYKLDS